ncbi:hypothetical protein NIES4102_18710 [Chondrocystis sp. NIES-4102]|nr:hypothetical protein NIES4102_18710 [Chondrocystis sp. NIES-4102]
MSLIFPSYLIKLIGLNQVQGIKINQNTMKKYPLRLSLFLRNRQILIIYV